MKINTVCVYCGSNTGTDPVFAEAAARLGRFLAEHKIELIYGGANCGTMNVLATNCLAAGGTVTGIITEQLHELVGRDELSELLIVPDMAMRKKLFIERSDALIALPGGLGTAEELLEALSHLLLGIHQKPCALWNVSGFFDPLTAWFDRMCEAGFLARAHRDLLLSAQTLEELFAQIEKFHYQPISKWWN